MYGNFTIRNLGIWNIFDFEVPFILIIALLPPATKLRQGNIFTPVCHSIHSWACVGRATHTSRPCMPLLPHMPPCHACPCHTHPSAMHTPTTMHTPNNITTCQWRTKGGGYPGVCPPSPHGPKCSYFMQFFLGKCSKFVCWRPLLQEILDPLLHAVNELAVRILLECIFVYL